MNKMVQTGTECITSALCEFPTCKPSHKLCPVEIVELRTNVYKIVFVRKFVSDRKGRKKIRFTAL